MLVFQIQPAPPRRTERSPVSPLIISTCTTIPLTSVIVRVPGRAGAARTQTNTKKQKRMLQHFCNGSMIHGMQGQCLVQILSIFSSISFSLVLAIVSRCGASPHFSNELVFIFLFLLILKTGFCQRKFETAPDHIGNLK